MAEPQTRADFWLKVVQTISLVAGMLGGIWSYHNSRVASEATRAKEALTRQIEARQPFLKLRQKRYVEVGKVVAQLVTLGQESDEYKQAQQRFRELYIVELSMVETPKVEAAMKNLAEKMENATATGTPQPPAKLTVFTPVQEAAYHLAHTLRNSTCEDFGWDMKQQDTVK